MFVYLNAILKKWVPILVFVLSTTIVFSLLEVFVFPSQYQSGVQMHVRVSDAQQYTDLQASTIIMNDYMAFATSESILTEVVNNLVDEYPEVKDSSYLSVDKSIKIEAVTQTRLFWVYVTTPSPQLSAAVANEIGRVMVDKDKELTGHENLNIMSKANVPRTPTFPKYVRDIPICAGAALLLAVAVVLFLDFLDRERVNLSQRPSEAVEAIVMPTALAPPPSYESPALHQPYAPPALFGSSHQSERTVALLRDLANASDDATQPLGALNDIDYDDVEVEKSHTASFVAVQSVTVSTRLGSTGQAPKGTYPNYNSMGRPSAGMLTPTRTPNLHPAKAPAKAPMQPQQAPAPPVGRTSGGQHSAPISPAQAPMQPQQAPVPISPAQAPMQPQQAPVPISPAQAPMQPQQAPVPISPAKTPTHPQQAPAPPVGRTSGGQHSAPISPAQAPMQPQQAPMPRQAIVQTHGHASVPNMAQPISK